MSFNNCFATIKIVGPHFPKKSLPLLLRKYLPNTYAKYVNTRRAYLHAYVYHKPQPLSVCWRRRTSSLQSFEPVTIETDVSGVSRTIQSLSFDVRNEGQLKLVSTMNVRVEPLNPLKHPNMDKLFIHCVYVGKALLQCDDLAVLGKLIHVDFGEENSNINVTMINNMSRHQDSLCYVQAPFKYDVDVSCTGLGEATLAHLESKHLTVSTEKGFIVLQNIKGHNLDVDTKEGHVTSHSILQGNVRITCGGHGCITGERMQGQTLHCQTDQGNIKVKAIYAENSTVISNQADVQLGSCHGNLKVEINTGNITVDAIDGDTEVKLGNGNAEVSMARKSNLAITCEKGDILIKVPQSRDCNVKLCGSSVSPGDVIIHNRHERVDGKLVTITGDLTQEVVDKSKIEACTKDGIIKLSYYDWFSSIISKQS